MPFPLTSLSSRRIENEREDYKKAGRLERYKASSNALYIPSFPGNKYIPYSSVTKVSCARTSITPKVCCGKELPLYAVSLIYDEDKREKLLFEKEKSLERLLLYIQNKNPQAIIESFLSSN